MRNLMKTAAFAALLLAPAAAQAIPVTWSGNGHQYEIVSSNAISWANARTAAQAMGAGWDLATITSLAEQNFIIGLLGPANGSLLEYYIGGLFENGAWGWVTGEAFAFTYWGSGEPNGNASEPRLALDARYNVPNWGWNDYTGDGAGFVVGYVAELHSSPSNNVPEPVTLGLLGAGLLGLGAVRRRQRA